MWKNNRAARAARIISVFYDTTAFVVWMTTWVLKRKSFIDDICFDAASSCSCEVNIVECDRGATIMISLTYTIKWRFHLALTSSLLKISNAAWVHKTNLWFLKKLWCCVDRWERKAREIWFYQTSSWRSTLKSWRFERWVFALTNQTF